MSSTTRHLELIDDCKRDILEGAPGGLTCSFDKEGTPGHPKVVSVDLFEENDAYIMRFKAKPSVTITGSLDVFPVEGGQEDKLAEFRRGGELRGMPLDCAAVLLAALYQEAYDAEMEAKLQAALELGSDQPGGISLYRTMCEPGYHCSTALANPEAFKGYLVANWNHVDKALGDWLEEESDYESGFWSDEWMDCSECGGLVRCQADSYSWKRYYDEAPEIGIICGDCLKKDIPGYLERLEGQSGKAMTLDLDPTKHSYVKVNDDSYENGWHPGQNDDPKAMSKLLRLNGIHRFLWNISGVGQFDVHFDLYVHETIKDELPRVRQLLA